MSKETDQLREMIKGLRAVYGQGGNVMAYARQHMSEAGGGNSLTATLIAYDLQAGVYAADALADQALQEKWCAQVAQLIRTVLAPGGTVLEVGVGEATTLAGVLAHLAGRVSSAYGFDISWSRLAEGQRWLATHGQSAALFVGNLFQIPLADNSVDVVYSSHSLEPNGGREEQAMAECLRVARHAVVLVEPIYELVGAEAQARMRAHGYVRGLHETGVRLGATVADYRLLEYCHNPLNPSGVLLLKKPTDALAGADARLQWRCPLTGAPLEPADDCYVARDMGIAYPVLRGIPLLRPEHAVIASKLGVP